jgi:magnesium transporter
MIEVFSYNRASEKIKKVELNKARFAWIRIVNPDPEKIKLLSKYTYIPVEELQESLDEEERPKVSQGKYLEIIYRAPSVVDSELETLPIYFYLLEDKLVTIEKKPLPILNKISENMSKNKNKFLFKKGFSYFVFHVMDKINDDFLLRVDKIAARIDIYENFSKKEMTVKDIEKIYDQSVTLSFFNQALIANVEVLNSLKKGYFKLIPAKNKRLFEELYFDVLQVLDTEKIQREALTNLINVHSILTSTRLNEFMKRLTTIALIVAIPTMLSGLYGMNFKYIPLADHPYGFYISSFIMIFITLGFYFVFKKSDWL